MVAPYLARWAQLDVEGHAVHSSDRAGLGPYRVRWSPGVYRPLTVRTQPFAEGFAESSTLNGESGGLTYYGGRSGCDGCSMRASPSTGGVRRRPLGTPNFRNMVRFPGSTGLVVGLRTRLGRAR